MMRGVMEWSQETLAEISELTARSIQRTEAGQQVNTDTKRAIARAFGCDDLNFLMQPITVSSPEKLEAQKVAFDRNHLVLDVEPVDGRGIIHRLLDAEGFRAIGPGNIVELPRPVEDAYAAVLDFVRDCMDVMDVARRAEMLGYGDHLDELMEPMRAAGFCLLVASREVNLSSVTGPEAKPLLTTILYVVAGPLAHLPKQIFVPRQIDGGL